MIRALYTAATGMNAQEINVATISNNIANVNSTGYKKSRAEFQDLLYQNLRLVGTLSPNGNQIPTGSQLGLGTKLGSVAKIYTQGDFIQTQNQLDMAITGKGFFQIALPDGTIAYTRAGSFKMNNTGQVVTADGLPLEPAITIPQDALQISIDQNGSVAVTQPGAVAPTVLGTIQLATFQNQAGLQAIGNNAFQQTDASGAPTVGNPNSDDRGKTQQGFLEMSNVSVVEEMVNLISAQRAYEMNSRTVQTADEMLQTANNMKR
jgi:flagellar basal-body rod protein FlgG